MRRLFQLHLVVVFTAIIVACSSSPSSGGAPKGDGGTSDSTAPSPGSSASSDAAPGASDSGEADAIPKAYALTSTALAEGERFDAANTCNGANGSPSLTWTAGPAGTMSYALILTDLSNGLIHCMMFDIPVATTSLPANVENVYQPAAVEGAKQTSSYDADVRGYLGPCPPEEHTYEFSLYALDVAALTGATMATTREQALALVLEHDLAVAKLTGKYAQP